MARWREETGNIGFRQKRNCGGKPGKAKNGKDQGGTTPTEPAHKKAITITKISAPDF